MDLKEQTQRTLGLVNALAMRAIELPPDAREAFIKAEVAKLREDLLRDTGTNPAVSDITNTFADGLAEWLPALVKMMQVSHGSSGGMAGDPSLTADKASGANFSCRTSVRRSSTLWSCAGLAQTKGGAVLLAPDRVRPVRHHPACPQLGPDRHQPPGARRGLRDRD
jgi:hypothetical protein